MCHPAVTAASVLRQDQLLRLKQKLGSEQLTEESLQQALTAQTQQAKQKTQELRLQLSQTQQRMETRLRHLSIQSHQAARKLQAAVAKVGRLQARLPLSRFSRVCSDAGPEAPPCGRTVPPAGGPGGGHLVQPGGRRPTDGEISGGPGAAPLSFITQRQL